MKVFALIINGRLVEGAHRTDVIDPATGECFAQVSVGSRQMMEEAIDAASRAAPAWAALPEAARQSRVLQLANAIEGQEETLARLLTSEQGKPLQDARFEVRASIAALRWTAGQSLNERTIVAENARIRTRRCPIGVIGCITPWNYPLLLAVNKIAPGLVTGNSIVLKPAPTTPLTSLELGRISLEVLPAGVLNVVADENDLGSYLTEHPKVGKISFTGSTATGRRIMRTAADQVKRLTLELGGNDAAIVAEDADLNEATRGLVGTAFLNAGQVCVAPKRIFVHDSVYDRFAAAFAAAARALRVGPGTEEGVQMGPLQNRKQFEKVLEIIADSRQRGRIIAGGQIASERGFFIEPTVVRDIAEGARLVDEEQFGPVVPLIRYSTEAEAIARANASPYGLGGSIWSRDEARALRLAETLECGSVWINQHLSLGPAIPFAGWKQSGIGVESGIESLEEFTRIQVINARVVEPAATQ